jgi:CheY-like chemotaxis protein
VNEETNFEDQVIDAFDHLYDLVYLRNHPLLERLASEAGLPERKRTRWLHHKLLEVVDELDPGPQAPAFSHEWRRHRLVFLRYVKGLSPQEVADQLLISLRHYYRVHNAALADIAALLAERYPQSSGGDVDGVEQGQGTAEERASRLELLRLEAARMAQADRFARLGDVMDGVRSVLSEVLCGRDLSWDIQSAEELPGVSIDRNLLRQMLLGVVGFLAERAENTAIETTAMVRGDTVSLLLRLTETGTVDSRGRTAADERLAALQEMATVTGAHILPVREAGAVLGFEVCLPTAERSVLVVDDNQDVLALFRSYLSPHCYRVVTASSAAEAVDKACEHQPYAVTLDLMMPEQDGWDLLQVLLTQPATCQIPVIVCSVLRQKELALSLGASAFLQKPVSEDDLIGALEALAAR